MRDAVIENLKFEGYILEDNYAQIPEIKGVYCAYACAKNQVTGKWELGDIVYFGKSEDGDSTIRARVYAHMDLNDNARSTLKEGEKLAYSYAATDNPDVCERALVAKHAELPRLANDKLTSGYVGSTVLISTSGKNQGMANVILFLANER